MDMVDPQPTLVELLDSHVLLPREFLPQIGISSYIEYTQRFLLRPAIEHLLEVVEEAILTERHLTGEALTRLLRTMSRERDA